MTNVSLETVAEQRIADNLARIRDQIATAAAQAGRSADSVRLIAVSKHHPQSAVLAAMQAAQIHFGENRVQEAQEKFPDLKQHSQAPILHLIGPLQTNKVKDALAVADTIDTLDRFRLLEAIDRHLKADPKRPRPRLLVQVNVDDEPQKAGIACADLDRFLGECRDRVGDLVQGLMCIPAPRRDPKRAFSWLAEQAAKHGLPVLSMGMSNDYEAAIACGATEIRVGTAIFGTRDDV